VRDSDSSSEFQYPLVSKHVQLFCIRHCDYSKWDHYVVSKRRTQST